MSSAPQRKFTVAEYLEREERSEIKHEYYQGEIFAMSGGTFAHAQIAANLVRLLGNKLQGSRCRALGSDLRVAPQGMEFITYPDVTVICGDPRFDPSDRNAVANPTTLIEVLSPSTERYDRTIKFGLFRAIATLRQYVLVSQYEARIETFNRNESNVWEFADAVGLESTIHFPSLQCQLSLAEIYDGVKLDSPTLRLNSHEND